MNTVLLHERWPVIESQFDEISNELAVLASELPRRDRLIVNQLSSWFGSRKDLQKAYQRPDVLAICNRLAELAADGELTKQDIVQAVRLGFCSIGRTTSSSGKWMGILLYPAVVFFAVSAMAVLFSVLVVPEFETMFRDFGIGLPTMTKATLGFSRIVRTIWLPIASVVGAITGVIVFMNLATYFRKVAGQSWLDRQIAGDRGSAAFWAWHMALLLDSGLDTKHALAAVGSSDYRSFLKKGGRQWIERNVDKEHDTAESSLTGQEVASSEPTPPFGQNYQMLDSALCLSSVDAKSDLFREIAIYYWERNTSLGMWWMKWLLTFFIWAMVGGLVIGIMSLFMPLVAVVSGLT